MTNSAVGRGVFGWDGHERRSDRYGYFVLSESGYDGNGEYASSGWGDTDPHPLVGRRCRIVARVLESRRSGHIGDLFRGIVPSQPEVGELVHLGEGELTTHDYGWGRGWGLLPDDERDHDWLEPRKLYRLHDQTVEVTITLC